MRKEFEIIGKVSTLLGPDGPRELHILQLINLLRCSNGNEHNSKNTILVFDEDNSI